MSKKENKMFFGGNLADRYKIGKVDDNYVVYDDKTQTIISENASRQEVETLRQTIIKTPSLHKKIQSNIKEGVEPLKFVTGGIIAGFLSGLTHSAVTGNHKHFKYEIGGL